VAGQAVRHPLNLWKTIWPSGPRKRTIIILVMQTLDSAMRCGRSDAASAASCCRPSRIPSNPNPTFIPAPTTRPSGWPRKTGGVAESDVLEALRNVSTTAHILGGAVMAADSEHGVVDSSHQVFGYENLLICDGSVVPANVGVNPSLTITAMSERAMSLIPAAA
jgi:cholesterol oxidase